MVRRALSAALFLALVHLSGADGGLLQADSLLSAALEGNNDYPVWNVAMESLSLVTPVMEIGWALSRYYRDHTDNPRISEPGRAAVGSFIITQAVVLTLKYTIRRERPARTYQPRLWNTRITPSFPSGHAATSAAVATVAAACDPQYRLACLAYALASAYSQVYVGNHYVGDVLVGSLIGTMVGKLMVAWRRPAATPSAYRVPLAPPLVFSVSFRLP